ncbi:MAG: hypothetical protein Q8P67_10765 [archaeon]|nr:hypothetical protein [archaeon]
MDKNGTSAINPNPYASSNLLFKTNLECTGPLVHSGDQPAAPV